jgi:hypothetical protein
MSKGARKAKLRDYSNISLTTEQSEALRKLLLQYEQHSITIAILGAVLVEHELDALLRMRFKRKDNDTWEKLVSDRGPLGTFYAKIVAGYGFGIYDEKVVHDLHNRCTARLPMGALILNKRFVRRCRRRNSGLVVEKREAQAKDLIAALRRVIVAFERSSLIVLYPASRTDASRRASRSFAHR